MPDFRILAAADHLQEQAEWTSVGDFERIEVADGRELPLAADRQPIIADASMFAPLGRRYRSQRAYENFSRMLVGQIFGFISGAGAPILTFPYVWSRDSRRVVLRKG